MTQRQAFKKVAEMFPGRTYLIRKDYWHYEGIGNRVTYAITLFSEDGDDCTIYNGQSLEDCIAQLPTNEEAGIEEVVNG